MYDVIIYIVIKLLLKMNDHRILKYCYTTGVAVLSFWFLLVCVPDGERRL